MATGEGLVKFGVRIPFVEFDKWKSEKEKAATGKIAKSADSGQKTDLELEWLILVLERAIKDLSACIESDEEGFDIDSRDFELLATDAAKCFREETLKEVARKRIENEMIRAGNGISDQRVRFFVWMALFTALRRVKSGDEAMELVDVYLDAASRKFEDKHFDRRIRESKMAEHAKIMAEHLIGGASSELMERARKLAIPNAGDGHAGEYVRDHLANGSGDSEAIQVGFLNSWCLITADYYSVELDESLTELTESEIRKPRFSRRKETKIQKSTLIPCPKLQDAYDAIRIVVNSGSSYSKFYLVNGRLAALCFDYDDAIRLISKAISSLEHESNRRYMSATYGDYLREVAVIQVYHRSAKKELETHELLEEVKNEKITNVTYVSLLTGLLAFLLTGVTIFSEALDFRQTALIMTMFTLSFVFLMMVILLFSLVATGKKFKKHALPYSLIISVILASIVAFLLILFLPNGANVLMLEAISSLSSL